MTHVYSHVQQPWMDMNWSTQSIGGKEDQCPCLNKAANQVAITPPYFSSSSTWYIQTGVQCVKPSKKLQEVQWEKASQVNTACIMCQRCRQPCAGR